MTFNRMQSGCSTGVPGSPRARFVTKREIAAGCSGGRVSRRLADLRHQIPIICANLCGKRSRCLVSRPTQRCTTGRQGSGGLVVFWSLSEMNEKRRHGRRALSPHPPWRIGVLARRDAAGHASSFIPLTACPCPTDLPAPRGRSSKPPLAAALGLAPVAEGARLAQLRAERSPSHTRLTSPATSTIAPRV
jgi:hypothetical protein